MTAARWTYGTTPRLGEDHPLAGAPGRTRVIIDNDFAGDPDDLFQLAHHLLVEGTQVCGGGVSRLREDDRPLYLVADGSKHAGLAYAPADATTLEYDMALDVPAARYVFNDTNARVWQMPRNVYRSSLVPMSV